MPVLKAEEKERAYVVISFSEHYASQELGPSIHIGESTVRNAVRYPRHVTNLTLKFWRKSGLINYMFCTDCRKYCCKVAG
jgi:hypothetical protein